MKFDYEYFIIAISMLIAVFSVIGLAYTLHLGYTYLRNVFKKLKD